MPFSMNLVLLIVSLVLIVLGIPLKLRRVPPNLFYGLRVPATLADATVWYEANAFTGRDLIVLGVVLALIAVLPMTRDLPPESGAMSWTVTAVLGTLWLAVTGWRRANRLRDERQAEQRER